jgi:hypothetical protein
MKIRNDITREAPITIERFFLFSVIFINFSNDMDRKRLNIIPKTLILSSNFNLNQLELI